MSKQANQPIIALTGASGFVGKKVLELLLQQDVLIKALIRPASVSKCIQSDKINWIEGELGNPISETRLCAGADIVIHMAGLVTARAKKEYYRVNAAAVGELTQAAARAGAKRFVYLSSLAAQHPKLSDYAGSKRAGEGALARKMGTTMKGVVIRAPAVFGAGDKATAPFYALIKKGFLPVPGGRRWKSRKISLIHVDDLATFITEQALSGDSDGRTVSMSTRASITWPEFAAECEAAIDNKVKVVRLPLALLYVVAGTTSVTKRLFGLGHLTLGKLREFLYEDWSIDAEQQTGTDLQKALRATITED